jgi:hypothetical protein
MEETLSPDQKHSIAKTHFAEMQMHMAKFNRSYYSKSYCKVLDTYTVREVRSKLHGHHFTEVDEEGKIVRAYPEDDILEWNVWDREDEIFQKLLSMIDRTPPHWIQCGKPEEVQCCGTVLRGLVHHDTYGNPNYFR